MALKKQKKVKPSAVEIELSKINQEALQTYKQKYYPTEQKFVKDIANSEAPAQARAVNDAAVSQEQAFSREQPGLQLGAAQAGIDPSSGRGMSINSGLNRDKANAKTQSTANANTAATKGYLGNLTSLVGQGKGQQGNALQLGGNVADAAQRQSILDARAAAAARSAVQGGLGTAAGYTAAYGMNRSPLPAYNEIGSPAISQGYGNSYAGEDTLNPLEAPSVSGGRYL